MAALEATPVRGRTLWVRCLRMLEQLEPHCAARRRVEGHVHRRRVEGEADRGRIDGHADGGRIDGLGGHGTKRGDGDRARGDARHPCRGAHRQPDDHHHSHERLPASRRHRSLSIVRIRAVRAHLPGADHGALRPHVVREQPGHHVVCGDREWLRERGDVGRRERRERSGNAFQRRICRRRASKLQRPRGTALPGVRHRPVHGGHSVRVLRVGDRGAPRRMCHAAIVHLRRKEHL